MFSDAFKDIASYGIGHRKPSDKPSFTSSQTLDKTFPNGFPDFNNFRNNPEGFYDNFCYDAGYASERSPEDEHEVPAMFDIETLSSSHDGTHTPDSNDGHNEEQDNDQHRTEEETSPIMKMLYDEIELTTKLIMEVFPFINEGNYQYYNFNAITSLTQLK